MELQEFGFFDSKDGDRKYSAADFMAFYSDFYRSGLVADDTSYLMVKANGGFEIATMPGKAYINGGFYKPKSVKTITLEESNTEYPRNDLVVLRWDLPERTISVKVIQGEAAENPTLPALTRTDTIYELGLAAIAVKANATNITQADITDLRFDNYYCGIIRGVIDVVDTSHLFKQYQAAWNAFVAQLGESDKVTINTEDVEARKTANQLRYQTNFSDLYFII